MNSTFTPKIVKESSPYLRKESSVSRMMIDVLIALIPVVIFSVLFFKWQALIIILVSVATMVLTEVLFFLIWYRKDFKKHFTINNILTSVISGVIFAMLIPVGSWSNFGMLLYVVIIGAFLGILLGKLVFGGLGSNIFNPAGVGRVVITICFSSVILYSQQGYFDTIAGATPLGAIKDSIGSLPQVLESYSLLDLLLGRIPGTMGEVSVIAILIGAVYLFIARAADLRITLSVLISFALLMFTAGLTYAIANDFSINPLTYMTFHLLSGGIMFGAVFMATDPVTSPSTKFGRIIYGAAMGAIVALIRLFGQYPEGMVFALLIMNMFTPAIDYYKWSNPRYSLTGFIGLGIFLVLLIGIIITAISGELLYLLISFGVLVLGIVAIILLKKLGGKQ